MKNHDQCIPVVLAAGKGTRMHSSAPKVLQTLLEEPMLGYVLRALAGVFTRPVCVVTGYGAEKVEKAYPGQRYIRQETQLGTGHALQTAMPVIEASGAIHALVMNGDAPLITSHAIRSFLDKIENADIAFAAVNLPDAGSYGRVVRHGDRVRAIVEAKDYDISKYGPPTGEVNAGVYYLRIAAVKDLLPRLSRNNANGEFYLTDLVALGLEAGLSVQGIRCENPTAWLGVNSPVELAEAEDMLAARNARKLLEAGVIMHAPAMIRVAGAVNIAPGCELSGPCGIYGQTEIASDVKIGSNTVIVDCKIMAGARVNSFCHLEDAVIGPNAVVGPYARLRPGAELAERAHVGNFVELKKARLGAGSKANHLTYLGDADIGPGANIGAGAITCNYDGVNKHKTIIGAGAFIGSNAALVAPVSIGGNALIGAGSVITRDVPDNDLAVARGKQKNLPRRKI